MPQILIIDDDKELRSVLKKILEKEGFTVDDAAEGKTALRMIYELDYKLIITDVFMPEKDGFEVIEEIRDDFPEAKIIVMTGGGLLGMSNITERLAGDLGVNRFLAKPFPPGEMIRAVTELIGEPANK